jgi:hypothetical protein
VTPEQIRTRRIGLLVGGAVIVLLLVLAIRGCLDAREERAYRNYVSDLSAVTAETSQLSESFFNSLQGGGGNGDISLQNEINGFRGTAQALLDRARGLGAPDGVSSPQAQIVLSYELRNEALDAIAEHLPTALGRAGRNRALRRIAREMEVFVASDVLFRRASDGIEQALSDRQIAVEDGVPESQFLPTGRNQPNYLDPETIDSALAGQGTGDGGGAGPDPGDGLVHGLALGGVTLDGVTLDPSVENTVTAGDGELEVQVINQGEAEESDITVTLSGDFQGDGQIGSIDIGATETVSVRMRPSPSSGDSGSLTVTVEAVPGEEVLENNEFTYELVFQ